MGNTTSAESIEDDLSFLEKVSYELVTASHYKPTLYCLQLPLEEAVSGASDNLLDFSPMFVVESLHKALLNIKYIPPLTHLP